MTVGFGAQNFEGMLLLMSAPVKRVKYLKGFLCIAFSSVPTKLTAAISTPQ